MKHTLTSMSISTIHFYIHYYYNRNTNKMSVCNDISKKNITQNTQEALTQTYTEIITTHLPFEKNSKKNDHHEHHGNNDFTSHENSMVPCKKKNKRRRRIEKKDEMNRSELCTIHKHEKIHSI